MSGGEITGARHGKIRVIMLRLAVDHTIRVALEVGGRSDSDVLVVTQAPGPRGPAESRRRVTATVTGQAASLPVTPALSSMIFSDAVGPGPPARPGVLSHSTLPGTCSKFY